MDEQWTLKDIEVKTEELNIRKTCMHYNITKGNEIKNCSYSLADYYDITENAVYVTKTVEKMIVYEGIFRDDEPFEQIDIKTVYNQPYLLINNHMDLSSIRSYDTNVKAIVTCSYYHSNLGTITFTENAVRKWWLARGIGIVKLEFNTFEFPLAAILYDTNIFSFSEGNQAEKIASFTSMSGRFRKECTAPPDTPERMLELCRLLRGICPQ